MAASAQDVRIELRLADTTLVLNDRHALTKEELSASRGIGVTVAMPDSMRAVEVVQFTLAAQVNGALLEGVSQSGELTAEQRAILIKLAPGDTFYLEEISVRDAQGAVRRCGSRAVVIR